MSALSLGVKAKPRMVKVEKVMVENSTVKTIFFRDGKCSMAEPGQFVMVWIPGVDEVPMSLSHIGRFEEEELSAISVRKVGEATEALHRLKAGDLIGVRGPLGSWFKPTDGKVILVGGGLGIAPLRPLLYKLKEKKCEATVIVGGKTVEDLVSKYRYVIENLYGYITVKLNRERSHRELLRRLKEI